MGTISLVSPFSSLRAQRIPHLMLGDLGPISSLCHYTPKVSPGMPGCGNREGAGLDGLPCQPSLGRCHTWLDLQLGRPELSCPLSNMKFSAYEFLSQISKKKQTKGRSARIEVAYIFLIERSQPPKYCFYRFIEVQYSNHSHCLKIILARGATWPHQE